MSPLRQPRSLLFRSLCTIATAAGLSSTAALAQPASSGRVVVVDGDTFDIGHDRIRLFGIDAPERAQPCRDAAGASWRCGLRAADALRTWLGKAPVKCATAYFDRDGRAVARCTARGSDVAGWLVREGWALDFARFSKGEYRVAEQRARRRRAGVWAGTITPPWQWRAEAKQARVPVAQATAPNPSCLFKGNVDARGRRIVHAPGQRDYDAVRINIAQGERWFCSLDAARNAGWRLAKR